MSKMKSRLVGCVNIFGLILFGGFGVAFSASYDDVGVDSDIASVESLRREVRQPAPVGFAREVADLLVAGNEPKKTNKKKKTIKNSSGKSDEGGYYKTYGGDADGEKGYEKQIYSKGDHGYKTLDTFHKQNGDNYGFEQHTAFGQSRGKDEGSQDDKSASHKSKDGDHEEAGTYADSYYAEAEGNHAGYTDGGDSEHYGDDGESAHYTSGGDGDGSYDHSEGYSENYSSDGGDDGSYESHSSYTSDGGEGEDEEDY